jgi:3-ketosteroid 9alpha-monooxygenase subunit A
MVAPIRRRSLPRRFPEQGIPRGWYQIGWSTDFAAATPVPLHYFDCDLVAYRDENNPDGSPGQVRVLDAYCRHMGAHLGFGGRVEGQCIRCPYHGWLYDADGSNVEVPYGDEGVTGVRLSSWPTAEVDGVVIVWYDPHELTAAIDPPALFARSAHQHWPLSGGATKLWPHMALTPQTAADNVCDAAHFKYIHGSHQVPRLVRYLDDGAVFRAFYEIEFGGGFERTWATPDGPVRGTIVTEAMGLGLLWNRMGGVDEVISMLSVTPIDATSADVRMSVYVPTVRSDGEPMPDHIRDLWTNEQFGQADADLVIWTNQTYIQRPPFLRTEADGIGAFRTWSSHWYSSTA